MNNILQCLVLVMSLILSPLIYADHDDSEDRQAQFMAIYLMHFANFIEWPDFDKPGSTELNICFYADQRLGGYIEQLSGETVNHGKINVIAAPEPTQLAECQIVFIESTQMNYFYSIKMQQSATLFVSDQAGFIEQGGTMEYFVANNKLRFAVDIKAAKEKGLILSSKLLMIAKIVE